MKQYNRNIHPFVRIFILIVVFFGTYLTNNIWIDLCFYLLVLLPFIILNGGLKFHFRFLLVGIVPIFLSFVLINIIVLQSDKGGWDTIFFRITKLTIYASVFQFTLTIPPNDLYNTFKKWGFKGDALIMLLSSFTVWNEIANKADKIVTARLARGYQKNRNVFTMAKQLPFVLNPLIIGIIRTSVERAESWHQKNIIVLAENYKNETILYSKGYNLVLIFVCIMYLLFCLYYSHLNTFL